MAELAEMFYLNETLYAADALGLDYLPETKENGETGVSTSLRWVLHLGVGPFGLTN